MSSTITLLTATSSPVDTAEFAANEAGNDRKYTRAEIVAQVVADLSSYETSNDAAVALKAPLASPTFTGTINATGAVTTVATPSSGTHATTKTYVDAADALRLPLAGGTMTGLITLSGAPSSANHATTKTYVDTADALKLPLAGGTMSGLVVLSGDPAVALGAATKQYVDGLVGLGKPSSINCSANPNYSASTAGDTYYVSAAGKIGGASGIDVEVNDLIICITTSASGDHATVGANFIILQANITTATTTTAGKLRIATSAEMDKTDLSVTAIVTPANLTDYLYDVERQSIVNVTGTTILTEDDSGVIFVTNDAGSITLQLPDPSSLTHYQLIQFRVLKTSGSAVVNGLTFTATAGNVNGGASFTLAAAECEHTIHCFNDGTNWFVR